MYGVYLVFDWLFNHLLWVGLAAFVLTTTVATCLLLDRRR
jgi:hypothetical protein